MPVPHLLVAGLNFTQAGSALAAFNEFVADRSLIWGFISPHRATFAHWCSNARTDMVAWLSQPHVLAIILAWWITFTVVLTVILCLGFGPVGVVAGSLAAGFQSFMYGGFTPAGGVLAILTSMAMLGMFTPAVVFAAAGVATAVAAIVWACGVGG